jgi:spectinomycin phosphotransferase
VREWLASFDDLAAQVAAQGGDLVATHGEPHPGNLLRVEVEFVLLDWDTITLTLPERDLWMLDDGRSGSLARYSELTGKAVEATANSLYRLAWTLADIAAAAFVLLFRSDHQSDQGTAWDAFTGSLAAGVPRPYGPAGHA